MTKIKHVRSKVATVMPEMGLEEEPISPVRREETVTKMKPKTTMRMAPNTFMCNGGATVMATTSARQPAPTTFMEISRSVRKEETRAPSAALKSARPARMPRRMIGSDRSKL